MNETVPRSPFRFHILGSSSSGNCALLVTPGARILIDAGFSARRIKQALLHVGENIEDIDAVFITHEHSDHISGVPGLARLKRPVFFANQETARAVDDTCEAARPRWKIFETGTTFHFQGVTISAFSIPHDAADPVGYTFTFGGGDSSSPQETLAWVTDLGYVPQLVREKLKPVDYLVLESNYDPTMLANSPRPPSLKQRIKGRHGHLSNDLALELLMTLENDRLRRVFLAHLSRECNTPELVDDALMAAKALRRQCVFTVIHPAASVPVTL
ncbi:MAG: MBL fold metallo-hydrolase [Puniceicoccales bacterium]|jgi:phosphoribosyl 1,2-cyclic phosphodiesterase|nr:MBL fold metallo-hydrolase [Puniceicoccales bacterium]